MSSKPAVRMTGSWMDCPRCGRPFWVWDGQGFPAHLRYVDPRLGTGICEKPERAVETER